MNRILIAGCGDLGIRAGLLLAESGSEVWGLRRSTKVLPTGFQRIQADLTDLSTLRDRLVVAAQKFDAVIFAVAADRFDDHAYRSAYVDGLQNLLSALQHSSSLPRRLIYVSSTSVYHQTDGSAVDETSPTEPSGFGGRRLLEGEAAALGSVCEQATILRLGGIYGPGRTRLLETVRQGSAVCYDPPTWTNRIHVQDGARALKHLALADAVSEIYIGVDDEPSLDVDVKQWLAERLGVSPPATSADAPSMTSRRIRSNKRCRNALLKASGFKFDYPSYREGYASLIAT